MQCPLCNTKLKTINSRSTNSGYSTWRRKHCPSCDLVITSKEKLDLSQLIQIEGQPYARAKLSSTLSRVLSAKLQVHLSEVLDTIENNLVLAVKTTGNTTLNEQDLQLAISKTLELLDRSSHLRYQALLEED